MMRSEDRQIALTDPDASSMATSGKGIGIVGYNVQIAVDTQQHLILAHAKSSMSAAIAINSSTCLSRRAMRSALRRSRW
jgi:hypothetical protein